MSDTPTAAPEHATSPEPRVLFSDLPLRPEILKAVQQMGFEACTPIQAKTLPYALQGIDVIGKAQTGTGKTAAFLIAVINDLLNHEIDHERYQGEPRAVVIAPTRELAMQIARDAEALTRHAGLNVCLLIGGVDYERQRNVLQKRVVDILVATPGRLLDFVSNREVYLDRVEIMVIDEADRMLDMGFIPQVKQIIRRTPKKDYRQTLLFSATFTQDVMNLASQWTVDPVTVEIEPEHVATETVNQKVYIVDAENKYKLLLNVLKQSHVESTIIFANRRDTTRDLHENLRRDGINCGMLSGEVAQAKRTRTLEDLREGKIQVLVATDVAGRGIHIDGISHVINYTLPEDPEDYVHRIGRTGRAGASGTSISFACEDDAFLLPAIEELLGRKLDCERPPESLTHDFR